jgi:ribosomal protein S18 acetylase RimI-like enzyme
VLTGAVEIARSEHAAELAQLARDTFAETFTHYPPEHLAVFLAEYTPAFFADVIADPKERVWIAKRDGRIVGYAHAGVCKLPHGEVTAACGELKRLYVRRGFQGSGLGRALLSEALAWLSAPGRKLWVGVFSENDGAQRLYAGQGFRKVGEYAFIVGGTHDREFILRRG